MALRPRFPDASCEGEAFATGRLVIPHTPTPYLGQESAALVSGALGTWTGTARVVVRSLVMVALAAFAILVLLPAAVAAQAALSI